MKRQDWKPTKSSRLCSLHFEDHAFTTDSKVSQETVLPTWCFPCKYIGLNVNPVFFVSAYNTFCLSCKGNRRLKNTAVPTVFSLPDHLVKKAANRRARRGLIVSSDAEVMVPHFLHPVLQEQVKRNVVYRAANAAPSALSTATFSSHLGH